MGLSIMEKMKTFYKAGLISIALVLFLIACTASTVTAENVSPVITETQITTNTSDQYYPAIYGDRIVWQDDRNGRFNSDIYMYDLSTKKETQITTSGSAEDPAIYGDRIVWQDDRSGYGEYDIYMYDLSTSAETRITSNGTAGYGSPEIYGDKIVWQDSCNGKYDIYMYDLSTQKETQITTSGSAFGPDIYGDKIVWEDSRGSNSESHVVNIYMYDLSTKREIRISNSNSAGMCAIYGDRVVWKSDDKVYMYNLSTKKETQITDKPAVWPEIYGDRIVYSDSRNGNEDIYMYNISTSKEIQVTSNKSEQHYPVIYDDKIVWQDPRNGNYDIYMATLTWDEEPPLDDNNTDDSNRIDNETQVPDDCSSELTPLDRTQALKEYVECTYKCNVKTKTGLATLLDASMCHYENCDNKKAVSMLKSFIHLAEKMRVCKQISAEEADYMVKEARKIIDLIETH